MAESSNVSFRRDNCMITGALAVLLGALPAAGHAQTAFDRSRNVGVLQRAHPEYDALGIRLRTFTVYPKLETGVSYDDNIYAAEDDAVDDTILSIRPSISVESTWSRHSLVVNAGANVQRYADLTEEDTTQYQVEAAGRLDILRDANVTTTARYAHTIEPRGSSSYTFATQEPIEFDSASAKVAGVKEFNRVRLSGSVSAVNLDFQDGRTFTGTAVDEDFRDSNETAAVARVDYALSPATALFGEIGVNQIDYDQTSVPDRDSDGARYLGGVNFELSNLVTGEVSAGYITRSFDNGTTKDVNRFTYRANVNWFPSQLVTVGFRAEKTINDSGIITTPAFVADTVGVQVDYEVLRNLIVTGSADYSGNEYRDIDRSDDRYAASLTATYLVNRWAGISLTYNQLTQDSSGADRGIQYTEHRLGVSLVLQR